VNSSPTNYPGSDTSAISLGDGSGLPDESSVENATAEDAQSVAEAVKQSVAKREAKAPSLLGYPATYLLVGINLAVFLTMAWGSPLGEIWKHHVWSQMFTTMFDTDRVVHFGASYSTDVLQGQWWRLLTATFVHINVLHLVVNLWCLWNLGLFGEPLLGKPGLVAVYLLTGVAGNVLSLSWAVFTRSESVVAGASGAVFGILGILIVLLSNRQLALPWEELRSLRRQVIFFAALNLAAGYFPLALPYLPATLLARMHVDLATMPRVDNSAHLGGFLCGIVLGLPLFPRMTSGRSSYRARQRVTFAAAALLLCLVTYAVAEASRAIS
jgi:rhomboid protease GluP